MFFGLLTLTPLSVHIAKHLDHRMRPKSFIAMRSNCFEVIQETDEFQLQVRNANSETALLGLLEVGANGNLGGPFTGFNPVAQDAADVHPTVSAAAIRSPINWIGINQSLGLQL